MTPKSQSIDKIYTLILVIISVGILFFIWPYISSMVMILVFAFLFTTVLLPGVDVLERKIKSERLNDKVKFSEHSIFHPEKQKKKQLRGQNNNFYKGIFRYFILLIVFHK